MKSILVRILIVILFALSGTVTGARVFAQTGAVSVTPDASQKSGAPASTVTFNLAVQAAEKGLYIITTTSGWSVTVTPNQFDLEANSVSSAQVQVVIPPSAQAGDSDEITVFVNRGQPSETSIKIRVTAIQPSSARPLVVVESYYLDQDSIRPGDAFKLFLSVKNNGTLDAYNLIFSFAGDSFTPQETGGVVTMSSLGAGSSNDISQRMVAGNSLWGQTNGSVSVKLSYNGPAGEPYTETFTVNLAVLGWSGKSTTATPTPTGTVLPRAQMVVSSYKTDVDPLQPGTIFNIEMEIHNLGDGDAKTVSMVMGGGSAGSVPSADGTPQPGGVSGAGADLSIFAPLGSSNIQFLGDIKAGQSLTTAQKFIVNVSANPGAYTLKLSFVYSDAKGNRQVDDQIITLLIYQLPQVEVNFYRDPGPISAMQPNTLPIQVVNLGRKVAVMGNMKITADNAELSNNVSLVGNLDAGGYFPLDVMLTPQQAGPLDVKITINYTDDFNQPRKIEQTLQVNVIEGGGGAMNPEGQGTIIGPDGKPITPSGGSEMGPNGEAGVMPPIVEETFWDKTIRFLKGLIGLDSAVPQPAQPQPMPGDQPVDPNSPQPVPVKPGGKG